MKYVLGLDLGIASIGWSLVVKDENDDFVKIEDLGVRIFSKLEDKDGKLQNQDRRIKRSLRRQRRRKSRRKEDLQKLFLKEFGYKMNDVDFKNNSNTYEIKIKGLTNALTQKELMAALYHYMKYRGFKSSRKVDDKKTSGKLLDQIAIMQESLKDKTITEVLLQKYNDKPRNQRRLHNTDDEYLMSVSRDMYLDELNKLFDTQISLNVCSETFRDSFFDIYNRQRDFSQGPGEGSIFGAKDGNFIEKMIGICSFDNELRAPKKSYSSEAFILLSFLNNFRYKTSYEEKYYSSLTPQEISDVFNYAKTKKDIKYKDIFKIINKEFYRVKGLDITKKQYLDETTKFKESKGLNIREKMPVELYMEFDEHTKKVLQDKSIPVNLGTYISMKKHFEKVIKEFPWYKEEITEFMSDENNYDVVSNLLLKYKTDELLSVKAGQMGIHDVIINAISKLESISGTINLSTSLCQKLIPIMIKGNTYDKAMEELNLVHTNKVDISKQQYLPEINEAMSLMNENLTNVNVKHTLIYLRQIINELIKKYGEISEYNIELTRELKGSFKQRRQMNFDMLDNKDANDSVKAMLLIKYTNYFKTLSNIKRDDIIKYKLFLEQNGKCAYSNTPIIESDIFNDNLYQIDHILPYSRSYDDSYTNKVLVSTKMNQDKKNKLPKEAFNSEQMKTIMNFIASSSISRKKQDKLLAIEIDDDFSERNKNDSSYMARLAKKLIDNFLKPEKCTCPSGAVTSKLKYMWGLNSVTHSLINENYKNINTYNIESYSIHKSISIDFDILEVHQKFKLEIKPIAIKGKKVLSSDEARLNKSIKFFSEHPSLLETVLKTYQNKSVYRLFQFAFEDNNSVNDSIYKEHLITILNEIRSEIEKHRNTKDRTNHLHHALDACVIACATPKMINRVTKYYQNETNNKFDLETGELIEDLNKFPLPYKDFRNEAIIRVYERDLDTMLSKLNNLAIYNNILTKNDVKVLYPARFPNKYKAGAFTKETIFGQRGNVITKKMPVDKLTKSNVENIYDKGASNKVVYEACVKWLEEDNDEQKYPFHPSKNNPIKSVLIEVSNKLDSKVKLKEKRFSENSECIGVDFYKKANDDKLYCVPIYYLQTVKGKKGQNVVYQIMWGQGNNYEYIDSKKLSNDYEKICHLPRYSLIELELKNGAKGLCYSAGATSGMFEVYSILGDGLDLVNGGLSGTIKSQYLITVSTIKSVKVRSISLLGKLN